MPSNESHHSTCEVPFPLTASTGCEAEPELDKFNAGSQVLAPAFCAKVGEGSNPLQVISRQLMRSVVTMT